MPLLGLGVYLNNECKPACLAALKHGYLYVYNIVYCRSRIYG